MHFLCRRPRRLLSCGAFCATAAIALLASCCFARPKDLGQRIRLGWGPDSAESVGTAMTKAIIREIQLEKLPIPCLFSQSRGVIRKIRFGTRRKESSSLWGAWPERYPGKIPDCTKHPRNIGLNGSQTAAPTPSRCFCRFAVIAKSLRVSWPPPSQTPYMMFFFI